MPTAPRRYQQKDKNAVARERYARTPWQKWYHTARWKRERMAFLNNNPMCAECLKAGKYNGNELELDHIIPHRGDEELFWDIAGNWQVLCIQHHSEKTARGQ